MQRPDGVGSYAGSLTGVYESMEYRKQGTSVYYRGTSSGTVIGLEAGTYYVRYKGINTYKPSADKELVVAPAAPRSGLTAENIKDGSLKISWPSVPYAIGYQVYRSTSSSDLSTYVLVGTVNATATTGPSFTDNSGLKEGTTYYYRIKSYIKSKSGKIVAYSDLSGYTGKTSRKAVRILSAGEEITRKEGQVGLTFTLKYLISSSYSGEKVKSVTIEDTSIAVINSVGSDGAIKITNKKVGTTNLVVTLESGFSAKCQIAVLNSISLKESAIDLAVIRSSDTTKANQYKLVPTLYPTNLTVTYRSGNTSVATVDSTGLIKAVGAGNTYVYAKSSKGDEVKVLVRVTKRIYVTSVKAEFTEKTILAGATYTFDKLTIGPSNAQVKSITYSVGNTSVAVVDSNGKVTGLTNGDTYLTIKVTDISGASVSCKVLLHIREIALRKVDLKYSEKTLAVGKEFQFPLKIEPVNTTVKIKLRTGNSSIATVDANGKVKAVSVGNTYLYAEASNGMSAKVLIKVVPYVPISRLSLNYSEKTIFVGAQFQFTATVTPTNATDKNVTWHCSHPKMCTVTNENDNFVSVFSYVQGDRTLYAEHTELR